MEIRKSKRKSFRSFCEEVDNLPTASKLRKIMSKDHQNDLGTLRRQDGTCTGNEQESLELLLSTHFPGSHSCINSSSTQSPEQSQPPRRLRRKWKKSTKIFKPERIKWAINSFKPYKSGSIPKGNRGNSYPS